MSALLSAKDARVEVQGVPLIDGLSCETSADRIVLAGDWSALFRVFSGRARVTRGELLVDGSEPFDAVTSAKVGFASFEALLPPDWTASDYLAKSAELIGMRPRPARRAAAQALDVTQLTALARRKLKTLDAAGRRAVLIAHAALSSPPILVLERPLAGLADDAAAFVHRVIGQAVSGRRSIVSVSRMDTGPERRFMEAAEEALLLSRDARVLRVDPNSSAGKTRALYVVATSRHASALAEELQRRGVTVLQKTGFGDAARFLVDLGATQTTDAILDAAVTLEAPLLEMQPLFDPSYGAGS